MKSEAIVNPEGTLIRPAADPPDSIVVVFVLLSGVRVPHMRGHNTLYTDVRAGTKHTRAPSDEIYVRRTLADPRGRGKYNFSSTK